MAYSELVKNFEKVRVFLRDFYIYGYKSRTEYDSKSARTYDDERRRIESWLAEYLRSHRDASGKNVFLSIDSRDIKNNPFYRALKTKSFTDADITLHFYLLDVLHSPDVKLTLSQILDGLNLLIPGGLNFDESTVRKKLGEYHKEGIIKKERLGKNVLYSRSESLDLSGLSDALDFFSEAAPAGIAGSFMLDRIPGHKNAFSLKHHYINRAIDSGELLTLLEAMSAKRYVEFTYHNKRKEITHSVTAVPVKILASVQNGRQNLLACKKGANGLSVFRLDYMSNVKIKEECPRYESIKNKFSKIEPHMWGVNCRWTTKYLEHVEFEVQVLDGEEYIINRLFREKRCGRVEKISVNRYKFTADIFDTSEIIPWIRSFICRIVSLNLSNKELEQRFLNDLNEMYDLYGV